MWTTYRIFTGLIIGVFVIVSAIFVTKSLRINN